MNSDLIKHLKNPDDEFTPIPFWFFNDEPDKEKIKNQLTDFVKKGVNGFVLHPRIGIPDTIEYLSDEYFEIVKYIVDTASTLHMQVVLYDEAMYPSGSAHGLVVKDNPEFAAKGIIIKDNPGDGEVITELYDGRYIVYTYTNGTIRGIHFGEDDGEANAPKAADILNPDAVAKFIHLTHDHYYNVLKKYFGNTIIGFFTDEPSELGRKSKGFRPWCAGMEKEIVLRGGMLRELSALFTREENETTKIYHKLIKKHLADNFYRQLSQWCENHGIAFMGHPAQSDDIEEQKYFHIPGQDLIQRREEPLCGGIYEKDSMHPKLVADIARLMGRTRNANECFGVCHRPESPWYFTGQDMKWYINWLGMRGTNLFIPHAFFYSVDGKRKKERPPDVGPHSIWWSHYKLFSDYMKRFSYLMIDSSKEAHVAVLCDNNNVPCEGIAALYKRQISFDYLPATWISQGKVVNDNFRIKDATYWKIINLLGEEYSGILDEMSGVYTDMSEFLNESKGLSVVNTNEECKNLRAMHIKKNSTNVYLLSNEGSEVIDTTVRIPCNMNGDWTIADLWDMECRQWKSGDRVTINPCQTIVIVEGVYEEPGHVVPELFIGDFTDAFVLKSKGKNQAEYALTVDMEVVLGGETFEICGEEMAECYCNGEFAGASFYSPHRFNVGNKLKPGENDIKVIMTGNVANIYDGQNIKYGLSTKN